MARILCIDDELDILELHCIVLGRAGHAVIAASNGEEALRLLALESVDLVISDLLRGAEGDEHLARIRQLRPTLPILVLSGLPEPPKGMDFADEFLTKGTGAGELMQAVERLMQRRAGTRATRA